MRKTPWPLYVTIAVAAASSMATSPPPSWWEALLFRGPDVRLDPTSATEVATFTVHASKDHADPRLEVVGLVRYELDAPRDLRVALVAPDQDVLAEQIHPLQGAGRIQFMLSSWEPLACASGDDVCEQTLAVEFDAGSAPGGAIDVEWYLRAQTGDEGTQPPEDLVFDIEFEGGQPVAHVPELFVAEPVTDEIGDGTWRMAHQGFAYLSLGEPTRRAVRPFRVRGAGAFSSSRLSVLVSLSAGQPEPVDLRLAVLADGPGAGVLAERTITVTGENQTTFELRIPELLACPGDACERDLQLVFETEDEIMLRAVASIDLEAVVGGEGEQPPAGVEIAVVVDDPWGM